MELNDEFEVPIALAETWALLKDAEKVVPCVPGAELREVDGDELRGVIKVRVGPVTVSYRGHARFESLDAEAHELVLKAEGHEIRGQGTTSAVITTTLSPSEKGTRVRVATVLSVTGKLAQFDRDEMAEASGKLVAEFARNLEATQPAAPEAAAPEAATPEAAAPEAAAPEAAAPEAATPESAAEAEIEATVDSYRAEIEAEVAVAKLESEEETASEQLDPAGAAGDREIHPLTPEPQEEREPLMRRLAPYLTVAGFLLIMRIVVYSLRRRRR